ncbi:MAG: ribonuclease HI [Bifidobacteriaceae bacterium]|jgi:ribonuclease HI|nr:ribonuclease HI [Bifidobacteriaceae bacterium]
MVYKLTVATDGSCLSNPEGAMGWAVVDEKGNVQSGGAPNGTNQIAELTAVYVALQVYKDVENLKIMSDSNYAIKASSEWVKKWRQNGWRNSDDKPIANLAIIQAIYHEMEMHRGIVEFEWVKGHNGDLMNEKADTHARAAAESYKSNPAKEIQMPKVAKELVREKYAHLLRGGTESLTLF